MGQQQSWARSRLGNCSGQGHGVFPDPLFSFLPLFFLPLEVQEENLPSRADWGMTSANVTRECPRWVEP